jgi:DNA topoisomerase-1
VPPRPSPAPFAPDGRLRYASDADPGLRRVGRAGRFVYRHPDGRAVRDVRTLARICALAVPPAWTDVWINPDPRGHLQASGRDARGRKQSRYHPRWRELRDAAKFDRLAEFGRALPALRRRVAADLTGPERPTRRRVVAAVVRLLDETLVRVGNESYARANRSYGLTTLRDGHVRPARRGVVLRFPGKGGKLHEVDVADRRVARILLRCQHLPGQHLFQYVGPGGRPRAVRSEDVNRYLRRATGEDVTAKEFRTWAGTVLALAELGRARHAPDVLARRRTVNAAIDAVAARLRNTRAVCRASYVHPAVVAAAEDGTLRATLARCVRSGRCPRGLRREEAAALLFLAEAARGPFAERRVRPPRRAVLASA